MGNLTREKILRYLQTNPVNHDTARPSCDGRSNSLAPSCHTEQSGTAAFEPTCMAIRGWPHCHARAAVGAAAAPFVLALSCNASCTDVAATSATLARPPRLDVPRVRLVVLFRTAPRWPSELEHRPKARRPITDRRRRLQDLERSNITLIATLIRRLVDFRHHEHDVVD